jgi:hypothetical protein
MDLIMDKTNDSKIGVIGGGKPAMTLINNEADSGNVFTLFSSPPIEMYLPKTKRYGTDIPVRTGPKINRNAICPKCESGLKYKKCCLLKTKT